jgi:hypothetical protein
MKLVTTAAPADQEGLGYQDIWNLLEKHYKAVDSTATCASKALKMEQAKNVAVSSHAAEFGSAYDLGHAGLNPDEKRKAEAFVATLRKELRERLFGIEFNSFQDATAAAIKAEAFCREFDKKPTFGGVAPREPSSATGGASKTSSTGAGPAKSSDRLSFTPWCYVHGNNEHNTVNCPDKKPGRGICFACGESLGTESVRDHIAKCKVAIKPQQNSLKKA